MSRLLTFSSLALGLAVAAPAFAQEGPPANPTQLTFPVTGFVSRLCSIGAITGGDSTFALGSLINPATGFLSSTLSAPAKTVTGSWCNAPSTVTLSATQLGATDVATAPANFTRAVNYTATASGWSTTAATFTTGAANNPGAVQNATTATAGTITVSIGGFTAAGGDALRPVASPTYQGAVTLTLAVVP
jgi:hypothetical protein